MITIQEAVADYMRMPCTDDLKTTEQEHELCILHYERLKKAEGYEMVKVEDWVILDDYHTNMPTQDGWYWIELSIGSIDRKKELRVVYYRAGERKFSGEFDWNYAIRWMPITPPKTDKI